MAQTRRGIAASLGAFIVAAPVSSAPIAPSPVDTELIGLGRQLAVEWQRLDRMYAVAVDRSDEALDALTAPLVAIVQRIEHVQAHTLEGVRAKALAISWCNDGDEISPDQFSPYVGATTDARIAASIVRDLLRIGGGI